MRITIQPFAFAAAAVALLALTGGCTSVSTSAQRVGKPGLIQGGIPVQTTQDSVKVTAVDASRRTLTLSRDDGSSKTYSVNESVKNFDQVKVGATVTAEVKAELSVYLLDHGQLPNADGTSRAKTINFNAKISRVDLGGRLLTLKFSNGQTMTIKAGLEVDLQKMATGDDVVMRSNEVTAITIK